MSSNITSSNSRLFIGSVRHRRFAVKSHQFFYRLFMVYLDLAELDTVFAPYWLWSTQGFNIAAFQRKRYLGDPNEPLLVSVKKRVFAETGAEIDRVCLLTHLAYFGYCFNPISIYFCFQGQKLSHYVIEVTNTPWGEQAVYVETPTTLGPNNHTMSFSKQLHVSPFLAMDYTYRLRCKHTVDHIIVQLENWKDERRDFDATLSLRALPITHGNLAKVLLQFPLMTTKVIAGIHWEALKLWLKGVPVIDHPK